MAMEDEDAPASSLQPVHKLSRPDPLHDLQLPRDMAIINERIEREFGPRPGNEVPPEPKRKPRIGHKYEHVPDVEEFSDMNARSIVMAVALSAFADQPLVTADAAPATGTTIPEDVGSLVESHREVLAYRDVKINDVGDRLVVLVTRWQIAGPEPAKAKSEWDVEYACELALFQSSQGRLAAIARNRKVVDCEYNHINRVASRLELDDQLNVSPTKITFLNDNIRGGSYSYSFELKDGKWRAGKAVSYYVDPMASAEAEEVVVAREIATYPKDFEYISLEGFDPDDISEALSRNKSIDWEGIDGDSDGGTQ